MYPVRCAAAVRVRVEEFVSPPPPPPLPKSYYLTQQEQIVGQGVSGAFRTDMNWYRRIWCHSMSECVLCVSRSIQTRSPGLFFIIRNSDVFLLSVSSLGRTGREWSVSLSYSGWPWLWFAVSLKRLMTHSLIRLSLTQFHPLHFISHHRSFIRGIFLCLFFYWNIFEDYLFKKFLDRLRYVMQIFLPIARFLILPKRKGGQRVIFLKLHFKKIIIALPFYSFILCIRFMFPLNH